MHIAHCAMKEPCKNHSDCLYVMVPRVYWCDWEMIVNLPSVNDGEDEDEEEESLHHGNCLLLDAFGLGLGLGRVHLVRVDLVLIP